MYAYTYYILLYMLFFGLLFLINFVLIFIFAFKTKVHSRQKLLETTLCILF